MGGGSKVGEDVLQITGPVKKLASSVKRGKKPAAAKSTKRRSKPAAKRKAAPSRKTAKRR